MSSGGLSALEKNAVICSQNAMQPIQLCVVTATISKQKQTKASIMVLSSTLKQSEHFRQ
jgi:hypothetical protein